MGIEVRAPPQFRVLGPLEAWRDGEAIRLGGARQRALLGMLLLRANVLVRTEEVIEELLGAEVSPTTANAVHAAVSRLRRALGADSGLLVTRPGGYVLALDLEQLDCARFERLAADGRERLAAGDPTRAASLLREALGLWRGPPLADLAPFGVAAAEVRRLQELRLVALGERIDADLELGRAPELVAELQLLVAEHPLRERLREQLMLALYRAGRQAEALAVYRETSGRLRSELGLEPSAALRRLERMVLDQDPALGAERPARPADPIGRDGGPDPVVCPFKGLAAFDGADAEYFCGRDRVVSDLVARLAESTIVGILGPSGIGKSSLLRAGVLPALRAGALPRSAGWRQIVLRPGEHPLQELARAIGPGGPSGLVAGLAPGERVVIAVDQLEELFTVCERADERAAFLERLADAARDPDRRVLVVCALRADLYGRLSAHARFAGLLSSSHALVGPMSRAELAQAIEEPAARAGLLIERPLVEALVAEVADEPGGLPLLSTMLLELWQGRDGRTLRAESYRMAGGVRGAVGRLAETAYAQLAGGERVVARNILLRLAGGEDGALSARRVAIAELERLDGAPGVLAALIDARLLTVGDGEVELSHEALLREWPRYRTWLEEDRIGRRVQAHLTRAAREWEQRGRDPAELYRGPRLTDAVDWADEHDPALTSLEREFLRHSRLEAGRAHDRQRAQNRRLRALLAAAGIALAVAIAAGLVAVAKQRSASRAARAAAAEARAALGRQLGAEAVSQPRLDLAMLLAREAVTLDRSQETEGTLLATLERSPAVIGSFTPALAAPAGAPTGAPLRLSVSPGGATLAVADRASGEVGFYATAGHAPVHPALSNYTGDQGVVYSADGSLLAYLTAQDGQRLLTVRDARTLSPAAELTLDPRLEHHATADVPGQSLIIGPGDTAVYYVYWTLDGSGRPQGTYVDRWSLPGGRLQSSTRIGDGALIGVALAAGGRRLVAVSPRTVTVLSAATLAPLRRVTIAPAPVAPGVAAVDPQGREIAIGAETGAVTFVDADTGRAHPGAGGGQRAAVAGIFFSPDGRRVATVGQDSSVIVWDPVAARPLQSLSGPAGQVQSAAVDRGADTLYTASLDGELLVWDLTEARSFGTTAAVGRGGSSGTALSPQAPPIAVSPDGSRFAVRVGSASVGVYATATLRREALFTIRPGDEAITALAWSPVAPVLAVAGHSGFVQMWNVDGAPHLVRSLIGMHALVGRPEAIQALAFSPDGTLLAASDENETRSSPGIPALPAAYLAVWQTSDGTLVAPPRDLEVGTGPGASDALAFAPSGTLLAASVPDGRVLLTDPVSGQVSQTLSPPGGATALAFSPTGALAVGTAAGTVQLFDPLTGARTGPALIAGSAAVTSVAFAPDGRRFATSADGDGAIKLWFTSTLQQEGPALLIGGSAIATAAFGGDTLLAATDDGRASAWPTALGQWEQRACAVAGRDMTRAEWDRFIGRPHYTRICG